MIKSMTAYGKCTIQLADKKINIEIRSLNSKGLDLNMRAPSAYKAHELSFRKKIASAVERGKIDFSLYIEKTGVDTISQINTPVIQAYIEELKNITNISGEKALEIAMRLPESLSSSKEEIEADELNQINSGIDQALEAFNTFREEEGAALAEDFNQRIASIKSLLDEATEIDVNRLAGIRTRLEKAVADLKENVDQNRFEQELIFYLEKYDITEEKVRLSNHLDYFIQTMKAESTGKKLGFIAQEIGREINTMGSKANDASLQKIVVQMKDELEKIKEQLLNVL
ncbi:MAG: YicC family protein [Flavobacteriaceae bacterium]|jgi:uncharacterized protein (TIGR00255 family)|nr:YicC family protein [Flavobacteriaceae bacterium]NVJ72522.1 YicC family protein [Flavobacteriaceae bacterium]